ncbi:MAG: hypothetical protein HZB46_05320 [Solirubrobacterales bacterium]|nr:hypothetical protein [Solirubrobacterales bacterium]
MSPITIGNRVLGVAENGFFTEQNTAPIPGGRLWSGNDQDAGAARAWNDARAAYIAAGGRPEEFMPKGPDSSARRRAAQDFFWTHQPPPAAQPYTSNHGWGLAVDVATRAAAGWLMQNGHRFCFSHDEGERVGEWWHFRYVGGYKPVDRLAHLTPTERRWCRELDKLRRTGKDPDRRRVLVRELTQQRKRIWRAAQDTGWETRRRRARYASLLARTKP